MKLLVSSCLLGQPCRYDGKSKPNDRVIGLKEKGYQLFPVCPEVMGGLSTPRPPAELQRDGRVVNQEGTDVTAAYEAGARLALELARKHGCAAAILKEKSPSCGCDRIYDGSFSQTLVPGQGVTARLLCQAGIPVLGETDLARLEDQISTTRK